MADIPSRERLAERSLADLFCHLSIQDRLQFRALPMDIDKVENAGGPENAISFGTALAPVARFDRGKLSAHTLAAPVAEQVEQALRQWPRGHPKPFVLCGPLLIVVLPEQGPRTGSLCVLSPKSMAAFLSEQFPGARLSPTPQRLLTCLLAGLTVADAARLDCVSMETRKTQAAALRAAFNVTSIAELQRQVGARLIDTVRARLVRQETPGHGAFFEHMARFYPKEVRALVLQDAAGLVLRYLDMGPRQGRPVIVLHPLILPPITAANLACLDRLGLRLVWPLRPGLLAPGDPALSKDAMIDQAVAGMELLRRTFCQGACHVLALAGGARIALAHASRHPGRLGSLTIAAASAPWKRRKDGAHRLVNGATELLRHSPALTRLACDFVASHLLTERRFPGFIRRQFATSAADLAVIEEALRGPDRGNLLREALRLSVNAIVADFAFQAEPAWHLATQSGLAIHFVHGAHDAADTPTAIQSVVNDIPGARLTMLPSAGQLFFGRHLDDLFNTVAADCAYQQRPARPLRLA